MPNLRKQLRKKLQNLVPEFCITASKKITSTVTKHKTFAQSQNIGCYISIENEVDTWTIIEAIWLQGKNCYLPVFSPTTEFYLQFVKFYKQDSLILSKYKIPEPKIDPKKLIAPQNLDLVIVPMVGFNANSFRLGHGTGCYDRIFEFKKQNNATRPYLLGIGYEWQQIEFEPKPWDVAMDEVITEQKTLSK